MSNNEMGAMVTCGCCGSVVILVNNKELDYCSNCSHWVCPACWDSKSKKCSKCD